MGRFRGIDTEEGWIRRELAGIRGDITRLSAAKKLQAATIGAGGLTIKGGDLRIVDALGNVVFSATDGPTRTVAVNTRDQSGTMPNLNSYSERVLTEVVVPAGFTQAFVNVFVTLSAFFPEGTTQVTLGVQPSVDQINGPPVVTGSRSAGQLGVSSSYSVKAPVTTASPLKLTAKSLMFSVSPAGTPPVSGIEIALSANVTFTRS